jgi:hypothetical protein
VSPTTGIALAKLVMTVAPQKLICLNSPKPCLFYILFRFYG